MSENIWISDLFLDSTNIRGYISEICSTDENYTEPPEVIDAADRNEIGEPLPEDRFPANFYSISRWNDHKKKKLHLFYSGFVFVSSEAAEIIRQFNLGKGALYPVTFWKPDRKTKIDGEYFHLNIGNVKDTFLPKYSPTARRVYKGRDIWKQPILEKDDALAFSSKALDGPDIWVDPRLMSAIFFSNRLVRALKKANIAKDFLLARSKVEG